MSVIKFVCVTMWCYYQFFFPESHMDGAEDDDVYTPEIQHRSQNGHTQKQIHFPNHRFGYHMLVFRGVTS